jgi:hypothetical protein
LALLLDSHVVPDCAAYHRTGDSVMTGDVAADAAHSGAAEAPSREARRRCHQRGKKERFDDVHGDALKDEFEEDLSAWQGARPAAIQSQTPAKSKAGSSPWKRLFLHMGSRPSGLPKNRPLRPSAPV